jgi:hypothetical protein
MHAADIFGWAGPCALHAQWIAPLQGFFRTVSRMPTQRGLAYSGLIAHTCWPMGISIFGAAPKSDS